MEDKKLIDYIERKTSMEEELRVEEWIMSSRKNAVKFNSIKSKYIASTFDETIREIDVDKECEHFLKVTTPKSYSLNRKLAPIMKYAAVFILLLSVGYLYTALVIDSGNVEFQIPEGAITLELDNGMIQVVSEEGDTQIMDSKGILVGQKKGTELVYTKETPIEKMVYNTLSVPFGKQFHVSLSDGTKVFLNSGSSIKYPVKFLNGQDRTVYLEGEAFFDVTKDAQHPFIVNAVDLNVRVLGTKFNVSSYPEDDFVNTVLVEGSVSLFPNEKGANEPKESLLEPGQIAQWHREEQQISIEETDTELYTAWISGKVVFKHMSFNKIIKKLERHYNVSIINNNRELGEELFTASFDIETIDQVLQAFHKNYGLNYSIVDNQIIID